MQAVREHDSNAKKNKCFEVQLTSKSFWECAAKKFNIPTLDLKVFDDSKTEVDEQVFDLLLKNPNLGVLESCLAKDANPEDQQSCPAKSCNTSSIGDTEVDSDDTIILQHSPTTRRRVEGTSLAKVVAVIGEDASSVEGHVNVLHIQYSKVREDILKKYPFLKTTSGLFDVDRMHPSPVSLSQRFKDGVYQYCAKGA
ncbi:uncharacterized protein LOC110014377 isoform X2 [Oryzias latipes]|nr:uncharacterized protein LOC110014377 isoform X2 [Oryzias latipes]XP_023817791.1 uncharacterized protein LOC110014377 isoform X2 [Oryzias latipes]